MHMKHKLALVALAAAAFGACSDEYPTLSSLAPIKEFFVAPLTGAAERPTPVTTTAAGNSLISILDTNLVRVEVTVTAIDSVTQAHIHAGDDATAGPIMVFLVGPFPASAPVARGLGNTTTLNGVLRVMDITRTTPFTGVFTFDSLMTRIKNGTAYVNVHTRVNPGGEIRGQIVPE